MENSSSEFRNMRHSHNSPIKQPSTFQSIPLFFLGNRSLQNRNRLLKIFHLEIFLIEHNSDWFLRLEINWIFEFNEFPLTEKKYIKKDKEI